MIAIKGQLMRRHWFLGAISICLSLGLSACDSSETRAEKHFQTALAYIDSGDIDRAIIEFRNVFKLDGRHKEARETYAKLQRDRGYMEESYSQYLRLVEQYPDDLEGRLALAEMALETGNGDEFQRHAAAAAALGPKDRRVQAVSVTLAYQKALDARDVGAQTDARKTADALIAAEPTLILARRVVIRDLLHTSDWRAALAQTDAGLAANPDARDLYTVRLGLLQQLGDTTGVEAQLIDLVARYPNEANMHQALVRWYIDQGNLDAAEAYMRSQIDPNSTTPDAKIALVQFITELRGPAAARTELDRMIAAGGTDIPLLRGIRAGLDFDGGSQEAAIAEMKTLVAAGPASQQTRNLKVALAQMLVQTDNPVGARAQVEEVLLENPAEVEALKLKAGWLIEDDNTGDAIAALRTAIGASPRDPDLMTLMARAHERDGNRDLMGEMLALAADAASYAPPEALRYAAFLAEDNKLLPAEDAVLAALRQQPKNTALLAALGDIYLRLQDWPRVDEIVTTLQAIDTDEARGSANALTVQRLSGQNKTEDLLAFLEEMKQSAGSETGVGIDAAIVQSYINRGNIIAALAHVDAALKAAPQDPDLQVLRAAVLVTDGKFDEGEDIYRALLVKDAKNERVWIALFELFLRKDDTLGAMAVLDSAIGALPESTPLNLRKAGALEQTGDIDGAIAIYETLYARDSNSAMLANNLASLLVSNRADAESLAHAELIARRLRGTNVPAFQDTYGWIAYRLGNYDEALRYLEPAATALSADVTVQYHLAAAYSALAQDPQAIAQFRIVEKMINPDNQPPFMAQVTAELTRLEANN